MRAQCVTVTDPFHPARDRQIEQIVSPCAIGNLAPQTDKPFIILRNGEAVLRKDWGRPVIDGEYYVVVHLPQGGGGGSNPMRVVLMIAVAVIAPYAAAALNSSLGLGLAAGGWQMGLLTAGIGLVGATLVNALIPPPKPPSPHQMQDLAAASPTYNINSQGNTARLDSAIPVQYGRVKCFPDFAAQPYTEYVGNEQFLYQLFCLGQGEFDESTSGQDAFVIQIEDTDIANFEEITYEIVGPSDTVTLFPTNVVTVTEVSGQELTNAGYIGPFTVNAAGTQVNALAFDAVMPRGMYHVLENGNLESVSITLKWEYREIDDDGAPVGGGAYTVAGTETITATTTTPQRRSFRYSVTLGRYEVRATRTDTKQTDSTYGHEAIWGSSRGYMPETRDFGDVTLVAMRMRASNQLSQQAARRVNITATRKLPIWNGSSWDAATATRSIAWALADACTNDVYGGKLADARVALDELLTLDTTWTTRGDEFNGRFDSALTFWEAVTKVAQAGRAKPYLQGGIMHFVRDEEETTPVALFSMRNMVRGSFSIEYILPSDETADAIEVGYWDENYWAPRRVEAKLSGSTAAKPAKIELFGVTSRDQAYREGMYHAANNVYRRRLIRFATEMEGFIPAVGDLIAIQHDMPAWGQFADAVTWTGGTNTLELSEDLTWDAGTHYVGLRLKDGSLEGPYAVTQGAADNIVVLAETPTTTPYTGTDYERTQVTFGWAETWRQEARVLTVKPRGLYEVEIECINEDASVHTAETGQTAPPIQTSQLPTLYTSPGIADLVMQSSTDDNTKALLTWTPAPGADTYQIEMAPGLDPEDADVEWTRVGETTASSYAVTAIYGAATLIRVRGVGLVVGPWVTLLYGESADYMWVNPSDLMWTTVPLASPTLGMAGLTIDGITLGGGYQHPTVLMWRY